MATGKKVDSYRFLSRSTKKLVRSWIGRERPRPIPWAPLERPLSECIVALVSTAGISCKQKRAFDMEAERQNPWWGDPSFRVIPKTATEHDVRIDHLHVDTSYAEKDPFGNLKPLIRGNLCKIIQTRWWYQSVS